MAQIQIDASKSAIWPMLILGIDPGLRTTGWGVVKVAGTELTAGACGSIRPNADLPMAERLHELFQKLHSIVTEYHPDVCAIEDIFIARNSNTTLKLGQARGVALLASALHSVPVYEYTPTAIKKSLTGSGRAGKQQMMVMISYLLPASQPDSDHA
ncbi:MAG: crossover junction endodeoxyribonuclease RuvC, partial [Pseudomonadota bacterium]